jgi:predicted RNA-binding protein
VSGFRERRWKSVQRIKPGDYLLCYLTGVSRWIGVLEVVSEPFRDNTPIWKDEEFPCRVRVRPVVTLTPETAVPVFELRDQLSAFQNLKNPNAWTGHFRGSPVRWKVADGEAVVTAVQEAEKNPIKRPVDAAKLSRRPRALKAAIGPVTVPDSEESAEDHELAPSESIAAREPTVHTEMQWGLLRLGSDMGLDVWVARNDRSKEWVGHRFSDLARLRAELPHQFDEATNRTVE